jgi:mono/diheme cytochrome c family protein
MRSPLLALAACAATVAAVQAIATPVKEDPSVARGRYLVTIGGCNDCHTPGYAQSGGTTPEAEWLTGDALGWKGPWGTTYPANLRLKLASIDEDQWVRVAQSAQFRPPMPWFNLHRMTESDLRAIHRYVKSLGPAGKPAPAYVPPDREAAGPVVSFPVAK